MLLEQLWLQVAVGMIKKDLDLKTQSCASYFSSEPETPVCVCARECVCVCMRAGVCAGVFVCVK